MRWLSFAILAYLIVAVHLGARSYLAWRGAQPNFVLLGVVFVVINAPRDPALLAAFILGALQDLFTQQPMGLHALSYGLVAMALTRMRQVAYREHPLTHFALPLVAGVICTLVSVLHGWIYPRFHAVAAPTAGLGTLLFGNFYTALLGLVVIGILQRMKGVFAFRTPRPAGFTMYTR